MPMSRPMNRRQSSRRAGLPALASRQVSDSVVSYASPTGFASPSGGNEGNDGDASPNSSPSRRGLPKEDASGSDAYEGSTPTNTARTSTATETDHARRHASWYMEALQQGGSESELYNILGNPKDSNEVENSNFGSFDDNEVLEQYRIMAQHEAYIRVKENTGFDIAEYDKRRKMLGNEPTDRRRPYGGTKGPKIRLPDPHKFVSTSGTPKPEEPQLPTPKVKSKFIIEAQATVPELCPGITVRGGAQVPKDEHVVRCLGCRGQVRVKLLATLVICPECNTVSPASSTRR